MLPKIIADDQKGFIKDRYIGENIRTIFDSIQFAKTRKLMGMLLFIDFAKAFDSLEWDFLLMVLKAYNFGSDFISWFSVLYANSNSCVINNGFFSKFFKIGRSCRQGDPLSPYLFILAVELLAGAIRNSDIVHGIKANNKELRIGMYADDTFLILDGTEKSLTGSLHIFKSFCKCSGLKINMSKTQAVWLGNSFTKPQCLSKFNLKFSSNFELLGITFDLNIEKMIAKNFDQKIIEIEKVLNLYKKLNLSLIGKVNVIKTLVLPKLVYLFTVLPNPDNSTWVKTRKIFKDFLWGDGQVKIVNKQLEKTIEEGGLKLISIDLFNKALKLSWIRRLITTSGNWQNIFISDIYAHKKLLWELNLYTLDRIQSETANPFWKNIINIWKEFKESFQGEIDPQTYPIQVLDYKNNSNLTKEIPRLVNQGIRHISDLLSNTEGLYGYQEFKQTYNVDLNFVDFKSLTHQIPRKWGLSSARKINKESVKQNVLEDILIVTKVCKFVYHKMIGALEFERGHEENGKRQLIWK